MLDLVGADVGVLVLRFEPLIAFQPEGGDVDTAAEGDVGKAVVGAAVGSDDGSDAFKPVSGVMRMAAEEVSSTSVHDVSRIRSVSI